MSETNNLFVKQGRTLTRVSISDINWIEAKGRNVYIHTASESISSTSSIGDIEVILGDTTLTRVHKSYLINLDKIEGIKNGKVHLPNIILNIGRTYMKSLKSKIQNTKT